MLKRIYAAHLVQTCVITHIQCALCTKTTVVVRRILLEHVPYRLSNRARMVNCNTCTPLSKKSAISNATCQDGAAGCHTGRGRTKRRRPGPLPRPGHSTHHLLSSSPARERRRRLTISITCIDTGGYITCTATAATAAAAAGSRFDILGFESAGTAAVALKHSIFFLEFMHCNQYKFNAEKREAWPAHGLA